MTDTVQKLHNPEHFTPLLECFTTDKDKIYHRAYIFIFRNANIHKKVQYLHKVYNHIMVWDEVNNASMTIMCY
jgi:hypothetical protein